MLGILLSLLIPASAALNSGLKFNSGREKQICPLVRARSWPLSLAWPLEEKIGIASSPNFTLLGPGIPRLVSAANFRGIALWESFADLRRPDLDHCLICYAFPDRNMNISSRLLCAADAEYSAVDEDAPGYIVQEIPVKAGEIHILQTRFTPSTGLSADFKEDVGGCRIMNYEIVAVTAGKLTNQCWMLPIVDEEPAVPPPIQIQLPPQIQAPQPTTPDPIAQLLRNDFLQKQKAAAAAFARARLEQRIRQQSGAAQTQGRPRPRHIAPPGFPPPPLSGNRHFAAAPKIFLSPQPKFVRKFGSAGASRRNPNFLPNSPHFQYFRNGYQWI